MAIKWRRFQPGLKNSQEVHVINRKGILARVPKRNVSMCIESSCFREHVYRICFRISVNLDNKTVSRLRKRETSSYGKEMFRRRFFF